MDASKIIPYSKWIMIIIFFSCTQKIPTVEVNNMFTMMPKEFTGIDFENTLVNETKFNVFKYRNYYNGGGVAIGDVNNDGLPDIYFSSNQQSNKLFFNEGGFRFKDVTKKTGVSGSRKWSTGVAMVDINGDQLLDIYVCNSGNIKGDDRTNELFINQGAAENGIPTFREAAADYGIDNRGFSIHAAFFDYDRDGDLDLYVMNNAFRALSTFDLANNLRHERDQFGGDYLYQNNNGQFHDVSIQAGIYGSVIGFGLGLTISDINNDGWLDIYVANDFFERDYLYINNGDGTFKENLEQMLAHTSLSSMGSDIADINNDGYMDIFTTDMLPEDDYRLKTTFAFETYAFIEKKVNWGYYHQVPQNALHINRGRVLGLENQMLFSDVALFSGVAKTDWTWGVDIVDLDNDGYKDLFMSNGIFRDVTNQDYMDYLMREDNIRKIIKGEKIDFPDLIEKMPSTPLSNFFFHNDRDLTFTNRTVQWGLEEPSFSSSLAYGDLDGDGDNDLVINNVNQPAFIYRNEADSLASNHYLQVKLTGKGFNSFAIGARISLFCADKQLFVLEQMPMRSFQASHDYMLTFGLGKTKRIDSLIVHWPDNNQSKLINIPVDTLISLYQEESYSIPLSIPDPPVPVFREITHEFPLVYTHEENEFIDFQREPLIPHKLSTEGPRMASGDVNGDKKIDFYLGGAKESPGKLFIQTTDGKFTTTNEQVFDQHKISEDVDAVFFDMEGDGDLDLYVVSGGNEYSNQSPALLDRIYMNDGQGNFSFVKKRIPSFYASGSCVRVGDFDGDGDLDLFVGTRSIPWMYGQTPESYLLKNDGQGYFVNVSNEYISDLSALGMVTDAEWLDIDNDQDLDLVVVGEWMPITIFKNNDWYLKNATNQAGLDKTNGWWNCVFSGDINKDGIIDLVAGNLGYNTKLQASLLQPATIYISDFDKDGLIEPVLCYYQNEKLYPMMLRSDLISQLVGMKEKYPTHADYAGKDIDQIFTKVQLDNAVEKNVFTFATSVFYGSEKGIFTVEALPDEAQYSPVYAIESDDYNNDGNKDLLLGGNFHGISQKFGRYDASYGTLLYGDSEFEFVPVSLAESGLYLTGQVRDMISIPYGEQQSAIIILKNNDKIQVYSKDVR